MKITVHSSKAVTPDYGGRSPPSRTEAITLSVFDKVTFDQYVFGIYFFHAPVPPNVVLDAAFAMALAAYRVWAGRLATDAATGHPAILLNDAGALFVEATVDVALDSVMPMEPMPAVTRLHPSRQNVVEPLRVRSRGSRAAPSPWEPRSTTVSAMAAPSSTSWSRGARRRSVCPSTTPSR